MLTTGSFGGGDEAQHVLDEKERRDDIKSDLDQPAMGVRNRRHGRGQHDRDAAGNHQVMHSLSQAEHAVSTRNVSLHTLSEEGWSAFWWGLGVVFVCVYCMVIALSTQQVFYHLVQEA